MEWKAEVYKRMRRSELEVLICLIVSSGTEGGDQRATLMRKLNHAFLWVHYGGDVLRAEVVTLQEQ